MKADVKKANITINTKYFKRFLSRSVPCPLRLLFCSFHSFSAYRAVVRVCNCCCCVAIDDAKLSHKLSFAWRVCVCVAALVCLFFFHSVGWLGGCCCYVFFACSVISLCAVVLAISFGRLLASTIETKRSSNERIETFETSQIYTIQPNRKHSLTLHTHTQHIPHKWSEMRANGFTTALNDHASHIATTCFSFFHRCCCLFAYTIECIATATL